MMLKPLLIGWLSGNRECSRNPQSSASCFHQFGPTSPMCFGQSEVIILHLDGGLILPVKNLERSFNFYAQRRKQDQGP